MFSFFKSTPEVTQSPKSRYIITHSSLWGTICSWLCQWSGYRTKQTHHHRHHYCSNQLIRCWEWRREEGKTGSASCLFLLLLSLTRCKLSSFRNKRDEFLLAFPLISLPPRQTVFSASVTYSLIASFCLQPLLPPPPIPFTLEHIWIIHFDERHCRACMTSVLAYVFSWECCSGCLFIFRRQHICSFYVYGYKKLILSPLQLVITLFSLQLTLLVSSGLISVSCTSWSSSIFLSDHSKPLSKKEKRNIFIRRRTACCQRHLKSQIKRCPSFYFAFLKFTLALWYLCCYKSQTQRAKGLISAPHR